MPDITRMHNPPHPGEVIREYLGEVSITDAAAHLGVSRTTLQRVVSGTADVSADMAYRLGAAFGTSAEFWAGMQMQFDLHQAGRVKRPRIQRLVASACDRKDIMTTKLVPAQHRLGIKRSSY